MPAVHTSTPLSALEHDDTFSHRHISTDSALLTTLNVNTLAELIDDTVPSTIRLDRPLNLPGGKTEQQALAELKALADQNTVHKSCIGMGYYGTCVPDVVARNLLENPGWYTAYTPYQPEIAQGRLEMLLNFQQMVMDLTSMAVANASLLDEATAAAEAMTLCLRSAGRHKTAGKTYFVADDVHPQTIDVIRTRAHWLGITVIVGNPVTELADYDVFGVQLQYPGTYGQITNLASLIAQARQQDAMVAVATDLLALTLLQPPGELGADIVLGNSQRFGVPMGFGGPHAAFFATTDKLKRSIPGRIIGVSKDSRGNTALRMAMQTREQHIRREKATSNICTAQALLANMAAAYAIYHGPEGLKHIAERVHRLTAIIHHGLTEAGFECNNTFFDTLTIVVGDQQKRVIQRALDNGFNLRVIGNDRVGVSLDETSRSDDIVTLFTALTGAEKFLDVAAVDQLIVSGATAHGISPDQRRTTAFLQHPVFNRYHCETGMMRYLKQLENRDYSLVHGMIPLGSCTMKLNAAAEMVPVSWPTFANIHPFAPRNQVPGYLAMIQQLAQALVEITGYDAISLQPNSGAQGEYAGLLAIRSYQQANGQGHRDVCLIPSSAHGTNPASATMLGMKVSIVACDPQGNVDLDDLKTKATQHSERLSALMVTYPSTHGVYEESIRTICQIIHDHGGQVYMDGANMNAMVGVSRPGDIGSDVSHLNLHKTFAIPHGGGGPGMGPIGVKSHLTPYLPGHLIEVDQGGKAGAVAAAPFGSASILPISWMYITMLGRDGLTQATEVAILHANYIADQLAEHYPILYRGRNNRIAHECILDIRPIKAHSGISEEDIAKRLMDYGFHAPTMSFPVAGTLMIEPTESESKAELDRFIAAMIAIKSEIDQVASGHWPRDNNPLVNAPHTMADLADEQWLRPYSRATAAFPANQKSKYWPTTNRIDNVYGDRNFVCSCPEVDNYR